MAPLANLIDEYKKRLSAGFNNNFAQRLSQAVANAPRQVLTESLPAQAIGFAGQQIAGNVGRYITGQTKPLVESVSQNIKSPTPLGVTQTGLQGLYAKFATSPIGAVANAIQAPAVGISKAIRTGNPYEGLLATDKAFYNPTSFATEGLGIKNPLLAMGVDIATSGGDPRSLRSLTKLKNVGSIARNFTMDTGEQQALVRASEILKNPEAYLKNLIKNSGTSAYQYNTPAAMEKAITTLENSALETLDSIAKRRLPKGELSALSKDPQKLFEKLMNMSAKNELAARPGKIPVTKPYWMSGLVEDTQSPKGEDLLNAQREKIGQPLNREVMQNQQTGLGQNISSTVEAAKTKLDTLYTKLLDRFHPLSTLANQAGEDQTMRNALTGYYGSGSIGKYHTDFELAPILKSVSPDDLRSYTIAQRDLELAGRNIKGSNTVNPQEVIQALEQKYGGNIAPLQQAASKLYDYQKNLVKTYLVDTGVISSKSYDEMLKNNQNYVPFKRVMDQVDEYLGGVPKPTGAGSVSSQNVIKGIKGSERNIQDPLESIVENTYKIVGLGKRQEVAKTIVNLRDKLPQGVIVKINGPIGNTPSVALFENGKVQHYAVPQEVADAAKGLTEDGMSTVVKILSAPTRVFRATATGINPEFMGPNIVRDVQSAFVNVGANPLKWISGLSHMIKKDELYQEFLKSGGMTARVSLDRPFLSETIQDLTNSKGLAITKPSDLYRALETLGAFSEQPTRILAFETAKNQALKAGLPLEEALQKAAYAAQEGTVNFARRGSDTKSLNAVYAFLNARAQGTDRLLRSLKADPKGAGIRLASVALAPSLALYAWNRQFPSYNDTRVVTENDKNNNFIIMLGDRPVSQLGGAQFIKIPKGDVGKLANIPEAFMSYLDGKGGDVAKSLGNALAAFSPVSNAGDIIPTAIRPGAENIANYNFFSGQNIVPDYKKNLPAQYQYSSYTAPTYRAASDVASKVGLQVSPAKLQNITEGYGTGIAKIATSLTDKLVPEQYKSDKNLQGQDINRTPILRRFLGGEKRTVEEQQAVNESKQNQVTMKSNDIKSAVNRGEIPFTKGVEILKQTDPSLKDSVFYNMDGKIKSFEIPPALKLTGNFAIDTELKKQYKSDVEAAAKGVLEAFNTGQITKAQALDYLNKFKSSVSTTSFESASKKQQLASEQSQLNKEKKILLTKVATGEISPSEAAPKIAQIQSRVKITSRLTRVKAPKVKKISLKRAKKVRMKKTKIAKIKVRKLKTIKV